MKITRERDGVEPALNTDELDRFVKAQARVIDTVMAELHAGAKRTHWMWFVFPQIAGLGMSDTARHYAILSREEASAYLDHPILGPRLEAAVRKVLMHSPIDVVKMFGPVDVAKLRSSLTLFGEVSGSSLYSKAIEQLFDGQPDRRTLALLR